MKLILSLLFFCLQSRNVLKLKVPDSIPMNVGKVHFQVQDEDPSLFGPGQSVPLRNAAQIRDLLWDVLCPGQSTAAFLSLSECNVGGVGLILSWNSSDGPAMCSKDSVCTRGWGCW